MVGPRDQGAAQQLRAAALTHFRQFAAIDWSGAKGRRHKGIAVALCHAGTQAPELVSAPNGVWSRQAVLDWLVARADVPLLVGIDCSFAAPFVARGAHLPGETETQTARDLWAYVDRHSDDDDLGAASFLEARRGRHFYLGAADGQKRDFLHWRACEMVGGHSTKPTTVYDAIGAAQVAKASFAGMRMLHHLAERMAVWPFDPVPAHGAVLVEIYTAIAARAAGMPRGRSKMRDATSLDTALAAIGSAPHIPLSRYDDHSTDAILAAAWLRANATRASLWHPPGLTEQVRQSEGWTFGVT
ncbi:hypothetical protein [Sphingomonas jeddahensis]|uniref:DUF429 domain-containing protein n=1 Tax=Sphingomonas jeddahensis TaxID=1915074 RepID=A0A1V2EYX9_9SPHN|nr:hypothetical protein [Sphingomonas jeddahensis]ONF97685.1 hypothetical protein SPHI_03170 [Sphingomonas jeddahensis]